MEEIIDSIWKAVGYLMISGVILFAWKTARDSATEGNTRSTLWKGLLWCVGIALFASLSLGDPSCAVQGDPLRGGCEEYADDSHEATTEQRVAHFMYYIILLYTPVLIGGLNPKPSHQN